MSEHTQVDKCVFSIKVMSELSFWLSCPVTGCPAQGGSSYLVISGLTLQSPVGVQFSSSCPIVGSVEKSCEQLVPCGP